MLSSYFILEVLNQKWVYQIQGWFQHEDWNLQSCFRWHTWQGKTPPPDCWNLKESNPLNFVSLGKKKWLFMLNTTFPLKAATLLFPGTLANLPPPFFHTWLIRSLDYRLIKGWSPHFHSHHSWRHALSCSLFTSQHYQHYLSTHGRKWTPAPSHNEFVCSAEALRCQAICLLKTKTTRDVFLFSKHGILVELFLNASRCSQHQLATRSRRDI